MSPWVNSFEGGTDTTIIDTTNSGGASGNIFTAVSGSPTFTAEQVLVGTLSGKVVQAGSGTGYVGWSITGRPEYYGRIYLVMEAWPTAATSMFQLEDTAATVFGLTMGTDGIITMTDHAGSSLAITSDALNPGVMYRLELRCLSSSTDGHASVYVYGGHGTDLHTSASTSAVAIGSGNMNRAKIGTAITTTTVIWTIYLDDLAVDFNGWIGPSVLVQGGAAVTRTIFIGGN